jgi:hypothetical protein
MRPAYPRVYPHVLPVLCNEKGYRSKSVTLDVPVQVDFTTHMRSLRSY